MFTLVRLLFGSLLTFVRSRAGLAAEILALRHQLYVLERSRPARLPLTHWDRALWAFGLRRWHGWRDSLLLVKPATVIAWHRKSLAGRPTVAAEIRALIRQRAQQNPSWGAPRIHGELLKLGYVVGERSVSRYLARIRPGPIKPRSQTWATFLPEEPCPGHRRRRHVRRADDPLPSPLHLRRPGTGTPTSRLECDDEPHRRLARPADRQRVPMGHGCEIRDSVAPHRCA